MFLRLKSPQEFLGRTEFLKTKFTHDKFVGLHCFCQSNKRHDNREYIASLSIKMITTLLHRLIEEYKLQHKSIIF